MKAFYRLVLSALTVIIITSCGQNKTSSSNDTLTIGVMSSMDYLPLAVAKERGYFADNDLDVTIQKFYSANDRDAALQSHNLDGTILDYTGGAIQAAGGIPLKFTSQCDGTFEMIVSKSSNINSIEDLKGSKIAISRNTVIDFCTDMALDLANISHDEVELVEINKIPLRLEMLNNAKIDATMIPDPFATIAKSEENRNIISMSDLGVRITGIAFHQKTIDEKKEALQKLYAAYNRAIHDLNNEPASHFEDILIQEIGIPAQLASKIVFPQYTEAKEPAESDLQVVAKWLKQKELVTQDFDINTISATGILD